MSNANYTHIQAHGIAGAFEPGFIYQAATVGLPHAPVGSPYRVIDVNVDLAGYSASDLIVLGDALTQGCIITDVTVNGQNSIQTDVLVNVGLGEAVTPSTVPTLFTPVGAVTVPAASPGVPGEDLNGGQAFVGVDFPVPAPAAAERLFPVLQVTTPITDPMVAGSVNVKISYLCA